jgi:iron complex outermembrane recepter protein
MSVVRIESNQYATLRNVLLTGGAASALSCGLAPVALAQPADAPVEKVTVTGTRIPQKNLITTSPVTQVTAADIDAQGVTRLEDLTNQLPQIFASQNSTVANGATGTATVNLRGLGAARTLVLINGRRMAYGTFSSSAADLNQIPGQLVDRVEVLTGGASAIYGSDAVAGVVNFIMRKDFEGMQVDAQYGFFAHHNDFEGPGDIKLRDRIAARAATNPAQFQLPPDDVNDGIGKELTGIMGASSGDGLGNVTAYASYRSNDQILQRDRDFSACSLSTAAPTVRFSCGGSGTSNPGTFTTFGAPMPSAVPNPFSLGNAYYYTFDNPLTPAVDESAVGFDSTLSTGTNNFRPFDATLDQYNFGPLNYYQRPDERYTLGAFAHYQIDEQVEAYTELMFSDYRTVAQIAPGGDFGDTNVVNCDNPLLNAQQRAMICDGFVLDNDPLTPGAQFGLGLGADGIAGDDIEGPDGVFGDDPLTPADESADDTPWNFDNRPCVDPDLVTPGNQCVAPLYVLRRNVEGGGRRDDLHYTSYRIAGGFRGDIVTGWDYDLAMVYSKTSLARQSLNNFSKTRMSRALDVVTDPGPDGVAGDDPTTIGTDESLDDGDPVCRSALDGSDPNCVPYNVFSIGAVNQDMLDYLQIPLLQQADMSQRVATFSINADLGTLGMKSPWAESTLQAAFGAEWRRDELQSVTDVAFQTADYGGAGGPTIGLSGTADVSDYFAELQIPLLEGQPFAHQVTIDLAYRYSDYDTGVTTDTYKIGADWSPTEDIRIRGSKQRAVRAANIIELFTAQGFNLFDFADDPCGADLAENGQASNAACVGDPVAQPWKVTAGQFGSSTLNSPAGQYQFLQGGNPDLAPEQSDTLTFGFVFTPTFVKDLIVSVDWFNIQIDDVIQTVGAENTINACYFGGDLSACGRIFRNPGTGQLWIGTGNVVDLNTNIGGMETTGIDINASYRLDLDELGLDGSGGLSASLIGTYLEELVVNPGAGADPFDCKGFYGGPCGNVLGNGPTPEWRHRFRTTWQTPWDADLSVTWRHIGEVEIITGGNRIDRFFDAEDYFDLAATVSLPLNSRLRLGVNNVFDNDPPISASVGTTGNGNTYPQTYDANGRWVFMGISVDM